MQFKTFMFFGHFIIYFFYQYDLSKANPVLGPNVRQAAENEFPFVVSIKRIFYQRDQEHIMLWCTGTLISNRDVLTVANALEAAKHNQLLVVVGSTNMMTGDRIYASWWMTYDEWILRNKIQPRYAKNNIGIIRLTQNVTANIAPAVLSTVRNVGGINVHIAGWGKFTNNQHPTIMQTANLKIFDLNECIQKVLSFPNNRHILDERYFCTKADPYVLLSFSDGGGPLIYRNTVIAINCDTVSRLAPNSDKVNIHLGVNFYRNFINDFVNNLG